jgi:hypothetical protein
LIEQGSGSWCRGPAGFEVALSFVIAPKGQRQSAQSSALKKNAGAIDRIMPIMTIMAGLGSLPSHDDGTGLLKD